MRWWEELDAPVLGRYRIERQLGEGGMARVFLATDVRSGRAVALKTPKIESFPPDSVAELLVRFSREFDSQASDPVQGVIPIYESGEFTDASGIARPFLAMQYLPGGSLGDQLGGTIGQREHRQTLAEVLDWLVPIARTVDRLHARKYLHRDIKPDNILFNSDGDPFLADLGIVGSLDTTFGSTMASTSMGPLGSPGSPGYQSPESIQADPALRNVTASDQFSLAVTVYEALAGRLPVNAGTNQEWYGALVHWSPTPLSTPCPELPTAASNSVMKALQARAFERFASCSEFARAMALAANTEAVPAPQLPAPPFPPREAAIARVPPGAATPTITTPAGAAPVPAKRKSWLLPAAFVALVVLGVLAWARSELRRYINVEPRVSEEAGRSNPGAQASASDDALAGTSSTSLATDATLAAPKASSTVDPAAASTVPGQAPLPAIPNEAVTVEPPVEVEAKLSPPVKAPRKGPMGNAEFEELARRCGDKAGEFDLAESLASCDKILAENVRGYTEALTVMNRARHILRTQPYAAAAADLDRAVELSYPGLKLDAYRLRGNARIKDGQIVAGQADLDKINEILGVKAPVR